MVASTSPPGSTSPVEAALNEVIADVAHLVATYLPAIEPVTARIATKRPKPSGEIVSYDTDSHKQL